MTGWAQVNGWRGNTSLEERIRFDIWYVENWRLGLDFRIMILTILRQKNAYRGGRRVAGAFAMGKPPRWAGAEQEQKA